MSSYSPFYLRRIEDLSLTLFDFSGLSHQSIPIGVRSKHPPPNATPGATESGRGSRVDRPAIRPKTAMPNAANIHVFTGSTPFALDLDFDDQWPGAELLQQWRGRIDRDPCCVAEVSNRSAGQLRQCRQKAVSRIL